MRSMPAEPAHRPLACRQWLAACAVMSGCAIGLPAWASAPDMATRGDAPSRQQVQSATDQIRSDPNLPGVKTEKTLRFKSTDKKPPEKTPSGNGFAWLKSFVTTVSEGARLLVWVMGALALAWLVLRIRRWVQVRAGSARHKLAPLPSHIGSLDIRPESLPDDVGSAVAALWQRGQQRPALSLLYRGALSRLVHLHAVPIRNASTEGECVALGGGRLTPAALEFFTRLVGAWQLAAYGGRLPQTAGVLALCAEFDERLGVTQAHQPASGARAGATA